MPSFRIDEHELHRHLLQRLRALESSGATTAGERLFGEWPNKLTGFARYLETILARLGPSESEDAMAFARRALDAAIDCVDSETSRVDRLEAERAFAGFIS